jgi:aspartyl-tRNA(Asn)/glutamyl-tRNA(Gln) amidotransferase subunit A
MEMPTVEEAAQSIREGRTSATELVERSFAAIEASDNELNAFVYVDPAGALESAAEVDRSVARGEPLGPLAGVPFGVKDLEDAAGMPTVKGSLWFAGVSGATRDDLHVFRLRAAGAIPVGKTAVPEFGSSAYTASQVHGVTRNPWDLSRTPGGSSGGSAAAVSAGLVPFCTASDGGGSIRTPAAFTGLPGLRPAYGRVPTLGVTHVAQNAVVFALATTVADTALLLDVCAGPDPRDRTSLPAPPLCYRSIIEDLPATGLRVAVSMDLGFVPVETEIAALVMAGYEDLVSVAGLQPVSVPVVLEDFFGVYTKIEGVDRWMDLPDSLWPDRADELDPALKSGWESGARATLPKIAKVYTERRRLEQQVAALFSEFDVLITPSASYPAFPANGPMPTLINGNQVAPFTGVAFPVLASLCNLPAITVPVGLTGNGLPVGMQIVARQHSEHVCLRLARLFEQGRPWPRHASR